MTLLVPAPETVGVQPAATTIQPGPDSWPGCPLRRLEP